MSSCAVATLICIGSRSSNCSCAQYVLSFLSDLWYSIQERKKFQAANTIIVDNVEYHRADTIKYLGLHIDCHLTWSEHASHVCAKVATAAGMMRKLNFLPTKILRKLYFALAHSHLSYAAIVWASAANSTLNKAQVLQRKALKACHKLNTRYPTIELFTEIAHGILPLRAIRIQQTCEMVYSALHRTSPTNIAIIRNHNHHQHRSRKMLRVPMITSNYGEQSITHFGPKCYNELPEEIQSINSESIFKSRLCRHLKCSTQIPKYIR